MRLLPHLAPTKRGAHSEHVLRPMTAADVDQLCLAKQQLPVLKITVAPEMVSPQQIEQLSAANIIVSLGHSNATFNDAVTAYEHGARCATHLYNAMSPLNHRQPGMVGAALAQANVYCGIIADGVHVHPAAIKTAMSAKSDSGNLFVVSDTMATAGSTIESFTLDGRTIKCNNARLELEDGTLAGADTTMFESFKYLATTLGVENAEAIRMVSLYPSACVAQRSEYGSIDSGQRANVLQVDNDGKLQQVWVNSVSQH